MAYCYIRRSMKTSSFSILCPKQYVQSLSLCQSCIPLPVTYRIIIFAQQSYFYKSIDIKFEDRDLFAVFGLAQHAQTPSPIEEEALGAYAASELDKTFSCHCTCPAVFCVYDAQRLLVARPANHNREI